MTFGHAKQPKNCRPQHSKIRLRFLTERQGGNMPRGKAFRQTTPLGQWMASAGLSHAEVVKRLGVNPSTVTRLLQGKPASPQIAKALEKLSKGKLDPWQLMGVQRQTTLADLLND
jgi:hypothetical protein